jgi:hypothetical protein
MKLDKPIERNGEKFGWFVYPVKFTPMGKTVNLGKQIFCRNEIETNAERDRLLAMFKQEQEDRKRAETERPIPGEVLKTVEVIRGQELRIEAIPVSILPHVKGADVSASELPPDEPFIDIVHAYWRGADGSGQAALSVARDAHEFIKVFRLIRYARPVEHDGKLFSFGVELAECDVQLNALRVTERHFCATHQEAEESFKEKQAEAPKLRAVLLQQLPKSPQEQQECVQIQQVQALADKTHAPAAKAGHLKVISRIRDQQRERQRIKMEADEEKARLEKQQHAAFALLIGQYFPTVKEVKARMKVVAGREVPEWKEELRRAMRVDCARLGIVSPFNNFALDGALAEEVARAMQAKSPVKPDQVEAVLNWIANGYEAMPEEEWTAEVANHINLRVSPAGLAKTISKKFGLKSKLKGRPVAKSGKTAAG